MNIIGRVIATEKVPTTIDDFCFWTDKDLILNPFDVVKVEHVNKSHTYAVVQEISHITDSASFLSDFISNDFGDVDANEGTIRIGMNFVKANVLGNDKGIFIPVQSNARVCLATEKEVSYALGLDDVKDENKLVCGALEMYKGCNKGEQITLPVYVDSRFVIGPEGAHLNISGISGLAAKTSYAMFLMKAIQDKYINSNNEDESVAFVIFNVKGKDLLAIDEPNDFKGDAEKKAAILSAYENLKLSTAPFKNVTYLYPYSDSRSINTYADKGLIEKQFGHGQANYYKFVYEMDKNNLDLLFANIDDSTQTMDSILNTIMNEKEFNNITSWPSFLDKISEKCQPGNGKDIKIQSWQKFSRLIRKSINNNKLFSDLDESNNEIRISDKIASIKKNDVFVIDVAKLNSDMQAFVFGNTIKDIYDLQLGEKNIDGENSAPSKIIVFIDELNKFASKEVPKDSPIMKQILDIAERGRSLGVILFAAEQFKSAIQSRVTGNCATFAYGRTNAIEISDSDYRYIPSVYKNMMTRLKQGEYIIQNPIFRSLLSIKVPEPLYKQFKS